MALSLCSPMVAGFSAPMGAVATRTAAPVMESIDDLKAVRCRKIHRRARALTGLAAAPRYGRKWPHEIGSRALRCLTRVPLVRHPAYPQLSTKLNPVVGYYNPLALGEDSVGNAYDTTQAIGYLRHAEIKHGRVAMAAFVGYIVQSNFCFPWDLAGGVSYASIQAAGSPPAQWDAVPTAGKLQILLAIGALELWGEGSTTLAGDGQKHYMRGGKPGYYPTFNMFRENVHPLPLDLWDPLGFTKKLSPERKEKALLAEINNGRLAMIGIMGMVSAAKGLKVPGLDSIGLQQYDGEVMAFFSASDAKLPFVSDMLNINLGY